MKLLYQLFQTRCSASWLTLFATECHRGFDNVVRTIRVQVFQQFFLQIIGFAQVNPYVPVAQGVNAGFSRRILMD